MENQKERFIPVVVAVEIYTEVLQGGEGTPVIAAHGEVQEV